MHQFLYFISSSKHKLINSTDKLNRILYLIYAFVISVYEGIFVFANYGYDYSNRIGFIYKSIFVLNIFEMHRKHTPVRMFKSVSQVVAHKSYIPSINIMLVKIYSQEQSFS